MTLLFELLPALRAQVPWVSLGALPTPVQDASGVLGQAYLPGELWLKRDDQSSPIYGGNKLRLLEHVLGEAQQAGATHVYATGATGSNFAIATALHAPRVGLAPGAVCFAQPMTPDAERSHRLVVARARVVEIAHWSLLPLAMDRVRRAAEKRGERAVLLSQARTSPDSLLGYVAAGLELAQQVSQGACPAPARIVLPIGSAATSAGILAGLSLARKIGLWRSAPPTLAAVRIAAWPLSRRARVLSLARKAIERVAALTGVRSLGLSNGELIPLSIVTNQLGSGYPQPTPAGTWARRLFAQAGFPILDDTYSAKAAAHLLECAAGVVSGPLLFWCTKSSAPLPELKSCSS